MSDWYSNIQNIVETQKENIKARDYSFFLVDRFLKTAKRVDQFSASCSVCQGYHQEVESIAGSIEESINGTSDQKRLLETRAETVYQHLKSEHGILPPNYNKSLYSFVGMVVGLLVGIVSALISNFSLALFFLLGWATGLAIGRVMGNIKDNKLQKEGLQL